MKRFFIVCVFVLSFVLVGCDKSIDKNGEEMMVFNLVGDDMNFSVVTATKSSAVAVTSLNGIYWEAKQGDNVVHTVSQYVVESGGVVNTGKFWPTSGEFYYRVANVNFATSTGVIDAVNTTDIVVGDAEHVSNNNCVINLGHIFARTGSFKLNTQADPRQTGGYELVPTSIEWSIRSSEAKTGTAGVYTIGTGWGLASTASLSDTGITSGSDLYLIPGKYIVKVKYTLRMGGVGEYEETFVREGEVTLVGGKVNNIEATAVGGRAVDLSFKVTLASWGSNDVTLDLDSD